VGAGTKHADEDPSTQRLVRPEGGIVIRRNACLNASLLSVLMASNALGQHDPDLRIDTDILGAAQSSAARVASEGSSVFVVWEDSRSGSKDIYFSRSADRGRTWLAADVRLDTDPAGSASSVNPRIAVSGQLVCVVWEDLRNGAGDIYLRRSLDGGINWLPVEVRLDTDPLGAAASSNPQLLLAGTTIYVAWMDGRNEPQTSTSHDR
jgi:hypothetical protein